MSVRSRRPAINSRDRQIAILRLIDLRSPLATSRLVRDFVENYRGDLTNVDKLKRVGSEFRVPFKEPQPQPSS
jgi:hypothetical protein